MQGNIKINSSSAQINKAEVSAKSDVKKYNAYTTILNVSGKVNNKKFSGKLGIAQVGKSSKTTFNEEHNIRKVEDDVQTFTDTADKINDNEIYLKKLDVEGKWRVLKLESEVILIWQIGSKIYYRSTNGGLDNMKMEAPYAILDIIQDDGVLKCVTNDKKILHSSDDGLTWKVYDTYYNWDSIEKASSNDVYLISTLNGFIGMKNPKNYNTSGNTVLGIGNVIYTKKGSYLIFTNKDGSMWKAFNGSSRIEMNNDYELAIQEDISSFLELNEESYLLPSNKNYIYKYVEVTTYFSKKNYWEKIELPLECTVTDIIYNRFDKTYYLLNDKCNYLKTTDFVNFEVINKNDIRGSYGTRSLEGLIYGTLDSSDNLVIAPARDKIENRLQKIKFDLDKTKWVGDGLATDGEKVFIKDTTTIKAREGGRSLYSRKVIIFRTFC